MSRDLLLLLLCLAGLFRAGIFSEDVEPSSIADPCHDKLTNCRDYGMAACMGDYTEWASLNCANYCGFCHIEGELPTTTASPIWSCDDKLTDCFAYGKSACVGIYRRWAMQNCATYCGYCETFQPPTRRTCNDILPNCTEYGHTACTNMRYMIWAQDNCAKTCGYCESTTGPTTEPCKDVYSNCEDYGTSSCVEPYEDWARKNCAATCGYCGGSSTYPTAVATNDNVCLYKNKTYREGESWQDGCDYNCTCIDANRGKYWCKDMCPQNPYTPPGCVLVTKDGECCPTPDCTSNYMCNYKGEQYKQNETWNDGCDYKCTCYDAYKGFYQCKPLCHDWKLPPEYCKLDPPEAGKCCPRPSCPPGFVIDYPPNYKEE